MTLEFLAQYRMSTVNGAGGNISTQWFSHRVLCKLGGRIVDSKIRLEECQTTVGKRQRLYGERQ